jgi:hypothetical protein
MIVGPEQGFRVCGIARRAGDVDAEITIVRHICRPPEQEFRFWNTEEDCPAIDESLSCRPL